MAIAPMAIDGKFTCRVFRVWVKKTMPIKVRSPTAYTWHSNLEWIKPTSRVIIVGGFTMFFIIFQWRCNLCEMTRNVRKMFIKAIFVPGFFLEHEELLYTRVLITTFWECPLIDAAEKWFTRKNGFRFILWAGGHKISTEHSDSANLRQGRWSRNIHCGAGGQYYTENAKKNSIKILNQDRDPQSALKTND